MSALNWSAQGEIVSVSVRYHYSALLLGFLLCFEVIFKMDACVELSICFLRAGAGSRQAGSQETGTTRPCTTNNLVQLFARQLIGRLRFVLDILRILLVGHGIYHFH